MTISPTTIDLVDEQGSPQKVAVCRADPNETVTWNARTRHCTIFFPHPGVFADVVLDIDGGTGSMTVLSTAPDGTYRYSVYYHDDDPKQANFLEGNSHPVMLIPGP